MSIIFHNANDLPVGQRQSDGYLNATTMCKAHGKKVTDWLRQESTLELVVALAEDLNTDSFVRKAEIFKGGVSRLSDVASISDFKDLITVKQGSPSNGGGTWLHPDLAVQLAQWCSAKCAIQVSRWVREWMVTSQNPIAQSQPLQAHLDPAPPQPIALPPAPGWEPEHWELLPPEDQRYFAESAEQRAQRVASERRELARFLNTADI